MYAKDKKKGAFESLVRRLRLFLDRRPTGSTRVQTHFDVHENSAHVLYYGYK